MLQGDAECCRVTALRVSGIALHLVGICSDADAAVLERPDINAGVVGLGFTLSGDLRHWGLATCILGASAGGAEGAEGEYCCRTESVDGAPPRAAARPRFSF